MTEQIQENISALMDGELADSTYTKLRKDDEFKVSWRRYHLISDIMHQRYPLNNQTLLSQSISDSIKQEPTILAPLNKPETNYIRPIAGMALAASVAAMAILGIQRYGVTELQSVNPVAQVQQVPNVSPNLEFGVSVQLPDPRAVQQVQLKIESDPRISRYILNHNEYQSRIGQQGVTPVSIFIEESNNDTPFNSGSINIDGVNVYSRVSNGMKVTVVGEVSDPTVKQIVDSVIRSK